MSSKTILWHPAHGRTKVGKTNLHGLFIGTHGLRDRRVDIAVTDSGFWRQMVEDTVADMS